MDPDFFDESWKLILWSGRFFAACVKLGMGFNRWLGPRERRVYQKLASEQNEADDFDAAGGQGNGLQRVARVIRAGGEP
jgi:hypothetical protein